MVRKAIISLLRPFKAWLETITFNNGLEFAEHEKIAKAFNAKTYFAHPYTPWERGLNENSDGLLRQYIPRGSDLRQYSTNKLKQVQILLNGRPRKTLDYFTPLHVFSEATQAT